MRKKNFNIWFMKIYIFCINYRDVKTTDVNVNYFYVYFYCSKILLSLFFLSVYRDFLATVHNIQWVSSATFTLFPLLFSLVSHKKHLFSR